MFVINITCLIVDKLNFIGNYKLKQLETNIQMSIFNLLNVYKEIGIELIVEDLGARPRSLTDKESANFLGGRRRRSNRRAHRGSMRVYRGVSRATVGNATLLIGKMGIRKDQ